MLNEKEAKGIKEKMKYTHICGSDFARELGVSRQAVNYILNRQGNSERIEKHIRQWFVNTPIKRLKK